MIKYLIVLISCLSNNFLAQTLQGYIIDRESKEPIPYSVIGNIRTLESALSDDKGAFKIQLVLSKPDDTLKVYAIGYKELFVSTQDFQNIRTKTLYLEKDELSLDEIEVSAKKLYIKKIGVTQYDQKNCSGFIDLENNWKGVETAIQINNSQKKLLIIKDFGFYIIKNRLNDTLLFRLNIYSAGKYYPGKSVQKKSILFKTALKEGEVRVDLSNYSLKVYNDFFVSLECLMDKVSIHDFCFAGEVKQPSFVRESALRKWKRIRGGGAAFNVTVNYSK